MRRIIFVLIYIGVLSIKTGFSQPVINEVMSSNISSIQDEYEVDKQNCPVHDCDWWYEKLSENS